MKKIVVKNKKEIPENTKKSFIKSFANQGFASGKIKPRVNFRNQGRKK